MFEGDFHSFGVNGYWYTGLATKGGKLSLSMSYAEIVKSHLSFHFRRDFDKVFAQCFNLYRFVFGVGKISGDYNFVEGNENIAKRFEATGFCVPAGAFSEGGLH